MDGDKLKDTVIAHDKAIDKLVYTVEVLSNDVSGVTRKLNDVIDVITRQNVLVERVDNLDNNTAEGFSRTWARFIDVEKEQNNLQRRMREAVPVSTVKWAIGLMLFYAASFGGYVTNELHKISESVIRETSIRDANDKYNTEWRTKAERKIERNYTLINK